MSAERFEATVDTMKLSKDDKVWFPRWIQRYASSLSIPKDQTLPVTEAQVIAFLREQRDRGTPAWLRLQAARAIEAYRSNILHTDTPSLDRVRQTLERIAASEKHGVGRSLSTTAPPQLPNDQEPKVIFDMRPNCDFVTINTKPKRPISHGSDDSSATAAPPTSPM